MWRLAGFDRWSPLVGPLGLAALEVVCRVGVELPGKRTTAAFLVGAIAVAGGVLFVRSQRRTDAADTAVAIVLGLLAAALPFIAWSRVGILGVTDNADLSAHLLLADGTGSGHPPLGIDPAWYRSYPVGPHALVATLHGALRVAIDAGFNGLLLATVAMSVCAALAVTREGPRVVRLAGALVAGIPFLGAYYVVQSSFKEPLLALMVVTWTLLLPLVAATAVKRPQAVLPLAVIAAGTFVTYSFVGLVWLAAVGAGVGAFALAREAKLPRLGSRRRGVAVAALFAVIVAAIAIPLARGSGLAGAVQAVAAGQTTGGNISGQLAAYQVFGLWPNVDPRSFGESLNLMRAFGVLGALAAAWAAWFWWWRERRPELPGAALATIAIYALIRPRATPYYSAKALVVAAFVVGLMMAGAIVVALARSRPRELRGARLAGTVGGIVVLLLAGWSSALALRGGRVEPDQHRSELVSLRPLLLKGPTLYTGQNDYLLWHLRGVVAAFPYTYITPSQLPIGTRPEKPFQIQQAFDWDSQVAEDLDRFRFVLTSRSPYTSAAPPNWHVIRTTASYVVWERRGATAHRGTLPEQGAPGAVLDCSTRRGAEIGASAGEAAVRTRPTLVRLQALRTPAGATLGRGEFGFAAFDAGGTAVARVAIPAGRWTASLQYVSPVPIELRVGRTRAVAPASQEGPGVFWRVGTFRTRTAMRTVVIHAHGAPPLASFRTVLLGTLAFTRAGERDRVVPLRRACGRYVDWLRLSAAP